MRDLAIAAMLVWSPFVFAGEKTQTLAELSFKNGVIDHSYRLEVESQKPVFKLRFQENRKTPEVKTISRSQADFIKNEATRIIWNSEFRKPASLRKCTKFVRIVSGSEKADVCAENKKATAMSYGLLNSIAKIFP